MLTKTFMLAGRASFIIRNPKGESVTVKINRAKDKYDHTGKPYPASFYVNVRHQNDPWAYVGFINPDQCVITPTRKSALRPDATPVKVAQWCINLIAKGANAPTGYAVEHTGRCGKCAKMLRDPESIRLGLGPVCRG